MDSGNQSNAVKSLGSWAKRGGGSPVRRDPHVVDVTEGSNLVSDIPPPPGGPSRPSQKRAQKSSSIRYPFAHRDDPVETSVEPALNPNHDSQVPSGHQGSAEHEVPSEAGGGLEAGVQSREPFSSTDPPPPVADHSGSQADMPPYSGYLSNDDIPGAYDDEEEAFKHAGGGYMHPDGVVVEEIMDEDEDMGERTGVMLYELRETPRPAIIWAYALQHFVSLVGNIVVIPMIMVPQMGGTSLDTAKVISSVMMVMGITTILHLLFGTRLPLVQGATFVYLAPALAIINSPTNLARPDGQRFKETMRELMGAVICASLFQFVTGYTGLMGLLLELFNPVVVAPTIAAVGLSFYAYGFPLVGNCVEIGIPQLLVIVFFALYLRRVSMFGMRVFQIHAISLALCLVWFYAFILTEAGVYTYSGCPSSLASSSSSTSFTLISSSCANHIVTMKNCRTDVNNVLQQAAWIRVPYPFQWGSPTFTWQSICIMITAAVIATVDSIGNYHATSLLVASRPPSSGIVSRGIGLEGLTSAIAGMWGIGTGATTLTENIHTVAVTRMGSRMTLIVGSGILIVLSIFGKVGALLASIPMVIIGGLLCVMLSMTSSLGLSSLRYAEMGSSRNLLIVGLSLFLSFSVPEYFSTYSSTNGHGPVNTSSSGLNQVLNSIFSLHMVIAFLVSFVLDNTVPGSATERGLYVWSGRKAARADPSVVQDYGLPFGLSKIFGWVTWVGL